MSGVSVIMPVYNGAPFIGQAIRSVLDQTWTDWELIVVNDGSTDATPEILQGFHDARIIVIQQANRGEAAARNTGLQASHGDYVAFLDADDLYTPNALADLSGFLDNHPDLEAVFSDGFFCDAGGKMLMRLSEHRPAIHTGNIIEPLVLSASVISATICTMIRRPVIEQNEIRFDERLVIGPDWDFLIHVARYARFGYLDQITCMYRVHQTNITRTSGAKRRKADLVRGRLKVMNADWFQGLSLGTRREFFYYLLIGLLGNDPEQQSILKVPAFQALPVGIQADLLRLVATNHLIERRETEFAIDCLRQSLRLQPNNRKSRVLIQLANMSPSLVKAFLSAWQVGHRAYTRIHTLGQRRPKSVPVALAPKSE